MRNLIIEFLKFKRPSKKVKKPKKNINDDWFRDNFGDDIPFFVRNPGAEDHHG